MLVNLKLTLQKLQSFFTRSRKLKYIFISIVYRHTLFKYLCNLCKTDYLRSVLKPNNIMIYSSNKLDIFQSLNNKMSINVIKTEKPKTLYILMLNNNNIIFSITQHLINYNQKIDKIEPTCHRQRLKNVKSLRFIYTFVIVKLLLFSLQTHISHYHYYKSFNYNLSPHNFRTLPYNLMYCLYIDNICIIDVYLHNFYYNVAQIMMLSLLLIPTEQNSHFNTHNGKS